MTRGSDSPSPSVRELHPRFVDLADGKWRLSDGRKVGRCVGCDRRLEQGEDRGWHPVHGEWCWTCLGTRQAPSAATRAQPRAATMAVRAATRFIVAVQHGRGVRDAAARLHHALRSMAEEARANETNDAPSAPADYAAGAEAVLRAVRGDHRDG